tara:strand:+ start:502 stop:693 length:192 start_codon:yes stop_codon:yes gene_type:complete
MKKVLSIMKSILWGVWTFSLKKGWDWAWSKTSVDEKVIDFVKEAGNRTNGAIDALKGKDGEEK